MVLLKGALRDGKGSHKRGLIGSVYLVPLEGGFTRIHPESHDPSGPLSEKLTYLLLFFPLNEFIVLFADSFATSLL